MKNKRNKITELTPKEYWQKKLNFDFSVERLRYTKLCRKVDSKELKKLNGLYFLSHHEWAKYIYNTIINLDIMELREYSRYLNYEAQTSTSVNDINKSIIAPISIAFITPVIVEPIYRLVPTNSNDIVQVLGFLLYLPFAILLFLYFIITFPKTFLRSCRDTETIKLFYEDIKNIVDERIKCIDGAPTEQ